MNTSGMSKTILALLWVNCTVLQIITLGRAKKRETISSASYRGETMGLFFGKLARPVIDWLFSRVGPQPHCYQAYLWQQELYK